MLLSVGLGVLAGIPARDPGQPYDVEMVRIKDFPWGWAALTLFVWALIALVALD